LLSCYPELARAWSLKESLREWYKSQDRKEAELSFSRWEGSVCRSGLRKFEALLSMFRNWHNEILNYFDHHMSNGFVEGENNRIKVIKCMAYGYRDLNNLRRRIFLSSNEMTANIKVSGGFHTY